MLAGAKGFKKLLNMFSGGDVKKNIAEKASGGAGKAGEGLLGGLGKGLGGLGKGIAGLGKGLGGAVGGMLKGLASGLEALGTGKVMKGIISLAGLAGVLWITGKALKEFTGLDWETMAKAGVALGGLILVGASAGQFAGQLIKGAIGLGIMGAALWVVGKAVQQFTGLDWETMAKAGVALAGLAVAGALAGLVAPEVILGAVAFAAMGAALWVIGEAIQAVGTGFQLFANSLKTISEIDGAKLGLVGAGLDDLTGSSKLSLLAFGAAALAAAPGLYALGGALERISQANAIGTVAANIGALSASLGSFKGLDTLKSVVDTINSLDVVKALTLGAVAAMTGVGLPTPTSSAGVSAGTAPKSSTLNSPSAVSADPNVGGDQSTPKDAQAASSGGAEKPVTGSGLETALGYQSSILQQLLESNNSLISINKDILKYTKVNA
jgi:hypothetical protein